MEALGFNSSGKIAARPVIGAELCNKRTHARGLEGRIVFLNTAVYDRQP